MAHNYNDNGTVYEIGGGKYNDNGTVCEIDHGKVNDNGTIYEISFAKDITITIGSGGNSNYAYIIVDGTKHYFAESFTVPSGTNVTVFANNSSVNRYGVYVNDVRKASTTVHMTVYSDVAVRFGKSSSNYTAYVTVSEYTITSAT